MNPLDVTTDVITTLGGGAMIFAAVKYILNLRANKKKASADAEHSIEEVKHDKSERKRDEIDWVLQKIKELHYLQEKTSEDIVKLKKYQNYLVTVIQRNDIFYCNKVSCPEKEPPIGEHHTKIRPFAYDINTEKDENIAEGNRVN